MSLENYSGEEDLREFLRVDKIPKTTYIYPFFFRFSLNSFITMILRILNSITKRRQRNTHLIIDCSVNINCSENSQNRKIWRGKDYKWSYSAKGLFVRMKLNLSLGYPSLKHLLFFFVTPSK